MTDRGNAARDDRSRHQGGGRGDEGFEADPSSATSVPDGEEGSILEGEPSRRGMTASGEKPALAPSRPRESTRRRGTSPRSVPRWNTPTANQAAARARDSRDPSHCGIVRRSTNPATAERKRSQEPAPINGSRRRSGVAARSARDTLGGCFLPPIARCWTPLLGASCRTRTTARARPWTSWRGSKRGS